MTNYSIIFCILFTPFHLFDSTIAVIFTFSSGLTPDCSVFSPSLCFLHACLCWPVRQFCHGSCVWVLSELSCFYVKKNHSFPRVEDERLFRLQTPVGLCGLDCLSLCHLFQQNKNKKNRKAMSELMRQWHRHTKELDN